MCLVLGSMCDSHVIYVHLERGEDSPEDGDVAVPAAVVFLSLSPVFLESLSAITLECCDT